MPYQNIPDSEFAEGQPARGITQIAMRDNLIAVAGGEADAPRIQPAGLWNISAGNNNYLPCANQESWSHIDVQGNSYYRVVDFIILNSGTVNVNFWRSRDYIIRINGTQVSSGASVGSATYLATVNAGDTISFDINGSNGSASTISNVSFGVSGLPPIVVASTSYPGPQP